MSKSKWIASLIREKLVDEWPSVVRESAGSWSDFPSLEDIRDKEPVDVEREAL